MTVEPSEEPILLPTKDQIDAAKDLHEMLPSWKRKDEILGGLKKCDPNFFEPHETLYKVLAVNDFYNAGCSNTISAADQIKAIKAMEIYGRIEQNDKVDEKKKAIIDLVNNIAKHKGQLTDGDIVFASKFAHFFINDEAFPILDDNAERIVQYYFGKRELGHNRKQISGGRRFQVFYNQFHQLKKSILELYSGYKLSNKELDHYLWLAGICEKLKRDSESGVNPEVREKYNSEDQSIKKLFETLFPNDVPL